MRMVPVGGAGSIPPLVSLAQEIWREYYTPMIGAGQVEYMLANFQSQDAIERQIRDEGFLYWVMCTEEGEYCGYFGVVVKQPAKELFLSKLYVKAQYRGKGAARQAIAFLEGEARRLGLAKISLTVHKQNIPTIKAYEKLGFNNAGPVVIDIGAGFVMDDYRMEKTVAQG